MSKSKIERKKGKSLSYFPNSYIVLDIETTGRSADFDEIIEVGAIKIKDGYCIDEFQSLIKPKNQIDDFIIELTGITNEMLSNAETPKIALKSFFDFIGDDAIVGHNINFDINFLYDYSMKLFNRPFSNNYIDTMRIAKYLLPNLPHHRLVDLTDYYEIPVDIQHRGLADCYSDFEVYKALSKETISKYGNLHNLLSNNNKYGKFVDFTNLKPKNENINPDNPFYNKHCCFTGTLEKMSRYEAAQNVINNGGFCDKNVTRKTDFLILGNSDYKSTKQKKAEELIIKGLEITILCENDFYRMISEQKRCVKVSFSKLKPPTNSFTILNSNEEKLEYLKKFKIVSKESKEIKPLFYNGLYSSDYCTCSLVGYDLFSTAVIDICGHLHCINTEHLKDMQPLVRDIETLLNNQEIQYE